MKALAIVFCWALLTAKAAELATAFRIVTVEQGSGTLRSAVTMKGEKASEVFVTIYREIDGLDIKPELLKSLLERAKGGFHEVDPLPIHPDFEFVVQTEAKGGLGFSVEKNGRLYYRGVREFAKGFFEDDDSVYKPGSFSDKELAEALIRVRLRNRTFPNK